MILILFLLGGVGDDFQLVESVDIQSPVVAVREAIEAYYDTKYPRPAPPGPRSYGMTIDDDWESPVAGSFNALFSDPYYTFYETTEKSQTEVTVTRVRLYSRSDGASCRIVISVMTEGKTPETPCYSRKAPITAAEIRKIGCESDSKVKGNDASPCGSIDSVDSGNAQRGRGVCQAAILPTRPNAVRVARVSVRTCPCLHNAVACRRSRLGQ